MINRKMINELSWCEQSENITELSLFHLFI